MQKHGLAVPFIVMTSYADVQNAVNAMKQGACDYIAKPVQPAMLLDKIKDALSASSATRSKKDTAPEEVQAGTESRPAFLEGKARRHANLQLRGFGSSDTAFGTHQRCQRYRKRICGPPHTPIKQEADKPFVAIDCGAMLKELAASEFFGHVKGSFTGAVTDKTGAFVEANGGTLFLDEVGNLSYDVQVQLLRAIQERKIRPVGSNQEIEVDVRLVCATNENLQQAISRGEFP